MENRNQESHRAIGDIIGEGIAVIGNRVQQDMSSDTAKEDASVVDSSVTEWKHDLGNLDDRGTCSVVQKGGLIISPLNDCDPRNEAILGVFMKTRIRWSSISRQAARGEVIMLQSPQLA
ncbi:unnamed protein product [Ilex paraguariensis]|uniref:Uncharacterized protein n=1 Tax=Ilex paraguariensis TaxID=185542 RepID=A0ABC8QT77_9AQUA